MDILLVIYGWVSYENCLFWAKKSEKYCNQVSARQSSTREESILPEKQRMLIQINNHFCNINIFFYKLCKYAEQCQDQEWL